MTTESLQLSFLSTKSSKETFNAIANFRGWWSGQIEGNTDKLGETFFYHYLDVRLCKIKLIEMIPDQKLVYHVVDNHFSFTKDEKEWTDTKIIFELETVGDKTSVRFTHEGLNAEHECFTICHESWQNYINKSLYNLIEMGIGNPNLLEGEGFNASVVEKWKLNNASKMPHPEELKQLADTYLHLSSQYVAILDKMTEEEINTVPAFGGWTAGQVVNHITKANNSKFFFAEGSKTDRAIDERIPELRRVFSDIENKMSSPEFIIPENRIYTKQESIEGIKQVFQALAENLPKSDLTQTIERLFGKATKWETAHFVAIHSQRHLIQLEKIQQAFETK